MHDSAKSAQHLATLYLHQHARLFGLDRSSLPSAPGMPPLPFGTALAKLLRTVPLVRRLLWPWLARGVQLAREPSLVSVRSGQSIAVIFHQMQRVHVEGAASVDLPVWGAGIRVMVASTPLRLGLAYSTLRPDLPSAIGAPRFPTTAREAAKNFGIPQENVVGLFIRESPVPGRPRARGLVPVLVYGRLDDPGLGQASIGRRLPYREHLDVVSRRVVRREVLASHSNGVTGLVFRVDPRSQTAQSKPGPYRPSAELNPFAASHPLWNLDPPGSGGQRELRGPRVYVAQDNPLGIDPPTTAGANFNYPSRTNDFAAVSAYYHCDAAFRMVEALGFPLAEYFAANVQAGLFPIRVVHRAPIRPGRAVFDGRTVNAQVPWDPDAPHLVGEIRFAFGDLSDPVAAPLGIAADARFAWHEFGHVLLIAATGEPEFKFAHSPGDALAAIICDLDSTIAASQATAPWRGVTFPWVEALRRHDRDVADGWGWHGSLSDPRIHEVDPEDYRRDIRDPDGYWAEQILSSTLFRLYLALGGDAWNGTAPDLPTRRAAAAYTVYLIVAAIEALGTTATVPASADGLAGALIDADKHTPSLLPDTSLFPPFPAVVRRGGAVHKVVRWAFERQGLYAPEGVWPWNAPGHPEAIDVYIEDRQARGGEYDYTVHWDTVEPHIRVAAQPNSGASDATPQSKKLSYVFVRVYNRGTHPTPPVATVRVFAAEAPGPNLPDWRLPPGPSNPWEELGAPSGAVTSAVVAPVPPGTFVDFGPFAWQPQTPLDYCLLACVDAPGDPCNALDPQLSCAVGPTPLAHLVPFDNNLGYRKVKVQGVPSP